MFLLWEGEGTQAKLITVTKENNPNPPEKVEQHMGHLTSIPRCRSDFPIIPETKSRVLFDNIH